MIFKNVAIIGSNGFLGSHLTNKLSQIPGLVLSLYGRKETSAFGQAFPYTKLDLTDLAQVKECFTGTDIVYYLASETLPVSSWNDPVGEIQKNLVPFVNFVDTISQVGVRKVVFTSSGGTVYGPSTQQLREDSDKAPFSPHGIVKLTMEYFLNYFRVRSGLDFDTYRISNVYGPGQYTGRNFGIINTFLEKIIAEQRITIFGNGEAIRNYIYVKDLAELMAFSLTSQGDAPGIYNAASNDSLTINQLVNVIKEVVNEEFEVIHTDTRQSDNPAILLDNTKITSAHPDFRFTPIKEGISETYKHIK